MTTVRKAIFPVAGMGTRFLPATKASPKEMLAIVDKPLIQYAAEEAVAAGITELIFVTSLGKRSIEDHFDSNPILEGLLEQRDYPLRLQAVRNILPENIRCIYIRQHKPLGLGHAISCAQSLIGDEPFAVLLADDLILSDTQNCMSQMVELYDAHQSSMVAVEAIPAEDSDKYGVVDVAQLQSNFQVIRNIVEKPKPESAPSNLAAVGRYIFTPTIFQYLNKVQPDRRGEIQLTDAIAAMARDESVYAYRFNGKRFDCGSKIGYLRATVRYALQHPEVGSEFRQFIETLAD